jgi:hypothetical protein
MNQHFTNELDKMGLQLIKITAGRIFTHGLVVLLEPKVQPTRMLKSGLIIRSFSKSLEAMLKMESFHRVLLVYHYYLT